MLLRRLVRNLLDNARLHAGGATALRVESDERQRAHRSSRTRGGGVNPEDREKIFEPFYRRRPPRARAARGSGFPSSDRSRARTAAP